MYDRTFSLLFGPKDFDSMIIDENPTEDAYYYDPNPITIECSLDEEGDDIISNVTYDDATYRESQEIKEFRANIAKELERYDNKRTMPIPAKYEPHRKLISCLFDYSLYAPKFLEKNLTQGWGSENECYRAIEALMIEQLRYFFIDNTPDYRSNLLRDIRTVREIEKIKKYNDNPSENENQ